MKQGPIWHFDKLIWVMIATPILLIFPKDEEFLGLHWEDTVDRYWIIGGVLTVTVLIWALAIRVLERRNDRH